MSAIGYTYPGLIDMMKAKDPDGSMADTVNMLLQENAMLEDAVTRECNGGTNHKTSIITQLPDAYWGRLNKGIKGSKAGRAQVEDTTGFLEARAQVDCRYEEVEPNFNAFRLDENATFLEGMSQEMQRSLLYEDEKSNTDRITGLAPRFNSLAAANGSQIIDAGGTGSDNTSVWFVTWGLDSCHMITPKGSPSGLKRNDDGKVPVADGNGDTYMAYQDTYRWHNGLCVRDWRKIVRIANIDVSDLAAGTVDIYKYMRKAFYQGKGFRQMDKLDERGRGRTAIYCNKDVFEALDAAGTNTTNVRLRPMEVEGKEVMSYRQFPIRQVDQLLSEETRVV